LRRRKIEEVLSLNSELVVASWAFSRRQKLGHISR
jgi:hypothetical protein